MEKNWNQLNREAMEILLNTAIPAEDRWKQLEAKMAERDEVAMGNLGDEILRKIEEVRQQKEKTNK